MQAHPVEDQAVWEGSPSQWLNFKAFFFGGLLFLAILAGLAWVAMAPPDPVRQVKTPVMAALALLLVVPAFAVAQAYLRTRCTHYLLTSERLRYTRGILSKRTDDTELYRVDDILLLQPLLLRLIRRGTVVLTTSDRSTPQVLVEAVPRPEHVRDLLRKHVEVCRDRKRTRVLDIEQDGTVL